MKDEAEPPDNLNRQKVSKLIKMIQDQRKLFLSPDKSKGEIAVCNPSSYDGHMIYRARKKWKKNKYGEISVIKKDGRVIITPEYNYEKDGIEDGRLSREGDTYMITYIAFNEDIENGGPKIALATTKDFKKIDKYGIIGPQVRFEEAISLVGPNSYYGKHWAKKLKEMKKNNPNINPFIPDKDAALEYMPEIKKWALWHRLEPAIQIAYADKISDFQSHKFWINQIKNLEKHTILKPGGEWATEKVGLGGLPVTIEGRKIGHIHGVEKKEKEKLTQYFYRGTFVEFDPKTNKVIAALRDPMLIPDNQDLLVETSEEGHRTEKYVNFPTILKMGPDNQDTLLTISGLGDKNIGSRTHNKDHILKELANPHNSIDNWNKKTKVA